MNENCVGTAKGPSKGTTKGSYICMDNGASTEMIEEGKLEKIINEYHAIHRGNGEKSRKTSKKYEKSKINIKKYLDCPDGICLFTKNTTESLNMLAHFIYDKNKDKKYVVVSEMEHHSNILPWRKYFEVLYSPIDENGNLDLNDFSNLLKKFHNEIAIVSITGCSNVTGIETPIKNVSEIVKKYNLKLNIDGAQLIPHKKISMKELGINYITFSGHKIYSPLGIGCIVGDKDLLDCEPFMVGGGQVEIVTKNFVEWKNNEDKHESGSQNVIGAIHLSKIFKYMEKNYKEIEKREEELCEKLLNGLSEMEKVKIYGGSRKIPVVSFTVDGYDSNDLSKILDLEYGISTRAGCFCAQIYVRKLLQIDEEYKGKDISLLRISLGAKNKIEDIDYLLDCLKNELNKK